MDAGQQLDLFPDVPPDLGRFFVQLFDDVASRCLEIEDKQRAGRSCVLLHSLRAAQRFAECWTDRASCPRDRSENRAASRIAPYLIQPIRLITLADGKAPCMEMNVKGRSGHGNRVCSRPKKGSWATPCRPPRGCDGLCNAAVQDTPRLGEGISARFWRPSIISLFAVTCSTLCRTRQQWVEP